MSGAGRRPEGPARAAARDLLRSYRVGPRVSKANATHQEELEGVEGRAYYQFDDDAGKAEIKHKIFQCFHAREPLALSEIAPARSRLFFDLDTNKSPDADEVTFGDVVKFTRKLQDFLAYHVGDLLTVEKEGVTLAPDNSNREWAFLLNVPDDGFSHKYSEMSAYILRSDLGRSARSAPESLGTFHIVFPMLFGDRDKLHRKFARVCAPGNAGERDSRRFMYSIAGSEKVLKYLDVGVLQKGFLRGPYCDKVGAGRPFVPVAIVDREFVALRGSERLIDDFALAFNACTLLYTPRAEARAPADPHDSDDEAPQDAPQPPPQDDEKSPEEWRSVFATSRKKYVAGDIAELIRSTYESVARDDTAPLSQLLDTLSDVIHKEFNHFAAVLRGCGRVVYVTKEWERRCAHPMFVPRDEPDMEKLFAGSKVTLVWPPPFRPRERRNAAAPKPMNIVPFKVWRDHPDRTEFRQLVVKPPTAVPPPEDDDLNTWIPIEVSRELCSGSARREILLPVQPEWIAYCQAWLESGCRVPPVSPLDNKHVFNVFAANEIVRTPDGEFARAFRTDTFVRHIRNVLCAENDALFDFVAAWFASLVQKPGHRLRSCLIIIGEEGCGKNIVVDAVGAILGPRHYAATASRADLGRFNSSLGGKTLLLLNECSKFSAEEEGVLRALVTEGTLRVEKKFRDALFVDNLVNVICITNITTSNLFSSVSAHSRRWCMARCANAPTPREDSLYWAGLWKWLGIGDGQTGAFGLAPGVLALADYLYNYKIPDGWNSGAPPATEELNLHKLGAMGDVALWWFQCLLSGRLSCPADPNRFGIDQPRPFGPDSSAWATGPVNVNIDALYQESFLRTDRVKRSGTGSNATLPWFKAQLRGLGAFYSTRPGPAGGPRRRTTMLYKLATCRVNFCTHFKLSHESVFAEAVPVDEIASAPAAFDIGSQAFSGIVVHAAAAADSQTQADDSMADEPQMSPRTMVARAYDAVTGARP